MLPFKLLFQSRKFLLALLDAVISTIALIAVQFFSPESADFALKIVAIYQPVIIIVIYSIAKEDTAKIEQGIFPPVK